MCAMGCGSSKSADVVKSEGGSAPENKTTKNNKDKDSKTSNGKKSVVKNNKNKVKNEENVEGGEKNKDEEETKQDSLNSEASTIPAMDYPNQNGNLTPLSKPLGKLPPLKPPRTVRVGFFDDDGRKDDSDLEINQNHRHVPVAFEVPAEDNEQDLIKRHPPRRLRKMVEDQPLDGPIELPSPTEESIEEKTRKLEEKVQQANQRRNQVLTLRVASARQKSGRVRNKQLFDSANFNHGDYGGEIETGERDETNGPEYL